VRSLALAWLILAATLPAFAELEPEEQEAYAPSEALLELFETLDDDIEDEEVLIVTPEQRAYFDALPDRAKLLFDEAIEYEVMTEAVHLGSLLDLNLRPPELELLMEDFCIVCHADPWQDAKAVFSADPEANATPPHLNLKDFLNDVHFRSGVSCAGCHGGDPYDVVMTKPTYQSMPKAPARHEDRTWIPEFCARCHADPAYMRRFAPDLPTDQYAKYTESHHGQLLLEEGDSKPAQCVSCHGSHNIRSPTSPRSSVHPKNVPATCGACHADAEYMRGYLGADGEPLPTNQLERYELSVHGRALLEEGDLGSPACNDCHGNHAAMPPEITAVAQVCRTCHAGNGELFDGSPHKTAFEENGWPECAQCHGTHDVGETDDSMLSEATDGLCYECHQEHAKKNPECERTAKYFHTSITSIARSTEALAEQIEHLAERGLDVEPLEMNVEELHDVLRQARSQIHAFNKSEFESVEAMGRATIGLGKELIEEAEAEYRFRRSGLLVSVGTMCILALLITLKIRELESSD
jgi:predicted CXXCH cytochrome family protein